MFVRLLIPLNTGASVKITLLRSAIWQSVGGISEFYSIICLRYGKRTSIKVPVILSHLFFCLSPKPRYAFLYFFIIYFIVSVFFLSCFFAWNIFLQHVFNTISTSHWILYPIPFPLFFLRHLKEKRIEIEAIKYISWLCLLHTFPYSRFVSKLWLNYLRVCTFCGNCVLWKAIWKRSIKIASGCFMFYVFLRHSMQGQKVLASA